MGDTSKIIHCERHGTSYATFLCGHLAQGQGLGFVQSNTEDDDPRPDAWCNDCDRLLIEEGEWNDKSEAFAKIQVLCANCYDEVRRRNLLSVDGVENGINRLWFLDNVLNLHETYPETFQILSPEMRQSLRPGDFAKLIFLFPMLDASNNFGGERMWVKVSRIDNVGCFGKLDSDPYTPNTISCGEKVLFGPEHVLDLIYADKQSQSGTHIDQIVDFRASASDTSTSENKLQDKSEWDD